MLECGIPLILKDDGPNMVIRKVVEKDKTANAETQDDTRDDNDNNEEE